MKSSKSTQDVRRQHNEQLIRRMKAGEELWSYDNKASWFPPRPVIEKDPEAIKKLYNSNPIDASAHLKSATLKHIERTLKVVDMGESKTEKTGS